MYYIIPENVYLIKLAFSKNNKVNEGDQHFHL